MEHEAVRGPDAERGRGPGRERRNGTSPVRHCHVCRAVHHHNRERLGGAALLSGQLRHQRHPQSDPRKHRALETEHGQRHEAAVRYAGEINPRRIRDAAPDEIGNQHLQEADIVGRTAELAKKLDRLRQLLPRQKSVPDVRAGLRKHRREALLWSQLCEAGLLCDPFGCTVSAVQHDHGRARPACSGAFEQIGPRLSIDGQLQRLSVSAAAQHEDGSRHNRSAHARRLPARKAAS